MPKWTSSAPDDPRGPAFPIVRTPPRRPLTAIVTAEDLVGTHTHFFKGRTIPCEAEECPACQEGFPYRWHAYVSAWVQETGLHFIFECTAQAAEAFTEYRETFEKVRGCLFEATRAGNRPNGRVLIRTKTAKLQGLNLPKPPDIIKCLAILWNLPAQ